MFAAISRYWSLITAVLKAKKEINNVMKEENTWKSRKFFITIINIVLALVGIAMEFIPAPLGAKIILVISVAYFIANVISKMTPTTKDDEVLAAIRDAIVKLGIDPDKQPVLPAPAPKPEEVPGAENPK